MLLRRSIDPSDRQGRMRRRTAVVLALSLTVGAAHGSGPPDPPQGEMWVARYDRAHASDSASATAVSPNDARVYVTGSSKGSNGTAAILTVAYSASTGREKWVARYGGPRHGQAGGLALAVSPDGSAVFVAGYTVDARNESRYMTIAYAARTGKRLWIARHRAGGAEYSASLALSPDGRRLFVSVASEDRVVTIAYAAANGERKWSARHGRFAILESVRIVLSPDGSRVAALGQDWEGFGYDMAMYSAATGRRRWMRSIYSGAHGLAFAPDGSRVYVTGTIDEQGVYTTAAYSASTGRTEWTVDWEGSGGFSFASSLAVSPDGARLFVTGGDCCSNGGYDIATVSYAADSGTQLWLTRYDDAEHGTDAGRALAVTPDGSRVYVTGEGNRTARTDVVTIAYSALTGAQVWVGLHSGGRNPFSGGRSVTVSPDGTMAFVAGASVESGQDEDVITIAYDTDAISPTPSCSSDTHEAGPVSGPVHQQVERQTGPARPYVHEASCAVAVAGG